MTELKLYEQVVLRRDVVADGLKAGDVATLVDLVPGPEGKSQGAVLEVFTPSLRAFPMNFTIHSSPFTIHDSPHGVQRFLEGRIHRSASFFSRPAACESLPFTFSPSGPYFARTNSATPMTSCTNSAGASTRA